MDKGWMSVVPQVKRVVLGEPLQHRGPWAPPTFWVCLILLPIFFFFLVLSISCLRKPLILILFADSAFAS